MLGFTPRDLSRDLNTLPNGCPGAQYQVGDQFQSPHFQLSISTPGSALPKIGLGKRGAKQHLLANCFLFLKTRIRGAFQAKKPAWKGTHDAALPQRSEPRLGRQKWAAPGSGSQHRGGPAVVPGAPGVRGGGLGRRCYKVLQSLGRFPISESPNFPFRGWRCGCKRPARRLFLPLARGPAKSRFQLFFP